MFECFYTFIVFSCLFFFFLFLISILQYLVFTVRRWSQRHGANNINQMTDLPNSDHSKINEIRELFHTNDIRLQPITEKSFIFKFTRRKPMTITTRWRWRKKNAKQVIIEYHFWLNVSQNVVCGIYRFDSFLYIYIYIFCRVKRRKRFILQSFQSFRITKEMENNQHEAKKKV